MKPQPPNTLRRNLPLFVTLAVLAAWYLLDILLLQPRQESRDRLLAFTLADIRSITLLNRHGRFTFLRHDQTWSLQNLPDVPIGKREIDAFLDECRNIRSRRRIDSPGPLADYGLDTTNTMLLITTKDRTFDLVLGSPLPGQAGFYAAHNGQVHVLNPSALRVLDRDLFAFRDKRLLDFRAGYVNTLRLHWRGKNFRLSRKGTSWSATLPDGRTTTLPHSSIEPFLLSLESYEASRFISGQDLNLSRFGFPTLDTVELTLSDNRTVRLGIGRREKDGLVVGDPLQPRELAVTDPYLLTTLSNFAHLLVESPRGPHRTNEAP